MRKIRFGFLVAIAFLAVMGAAASTAAAENYFQATEYMAAVKGEGEGKTPAFTFEGSSVECGTVTVTGELQEPLEEIEVLPEYKSCKGLGFLNATVNVEGCRYRLDADTPDLDIVCPAGKTIKIVVATCEVQIGSQDSLQEMEYVNNESAPKTLTIKAEVEGLKYTKTKDGFGCPLSGTGEKSDGTYAGNVLASAFKGAQVGLLVGIPLVTKLCAEKVKECPEGQTYPSGSEINSESKLAEIVISRVGGNPDWQIGCAKATIKGKTSELEGKPHLATTVPNVSFPNCSIIGGGSGACTVAMTPGTNPKIDAVGNDKDGHWWLGKKTLLEVTCAETGFCKFESLPVVTIRGGEMGSATIEANRPFGWIGGVPCEKGATWNGSYVIEQPGNLFVTH
jgi:hypothetical protein